MVSFFERDGSLSLSVDRKNLIEGLMTIIQVQERENDVLKCCQNVFRSALANDDVERIDIPVYAYVARRLIERNHSEHILS